MTQTNQEKPETHKVAKLYIKQLAHKMLDVNKKFKEENFHLDNSFLAQVDVHAGKINLQASLSTCLRMIKKEHQEEVYENFMKDFKKEVFWALKEGECEFPELTGAMK